MTPLDPVAVAAITVALALGGLIKGATGAGAPVVAVPVMAAFYDVRLAVVLMVATNIVTNVGQFLRYRPHQLSGAFSARFAGGGTVGTFLGTALLAGLPTAVLSAIMAGVLCLYIALRILRPEATLPQPIAARLALPVGFGGGLLQGASGMSAPVSLSFLNAMRLERTTFIATISAFFAATSLVQIPAMFFYGLLTPALLAASVAALVPVLVGLPIGAWLARRISARAFDRIVLVLLAALAARLVYTAL